MGLASLLGESPRRRVPAEQRTKRAPGRDIPLDEIQTNPNQPRRRFDGDALSELAASIRENGVIQPVLLRKVENGYELIAGERRFRAAGLAGLERIPAVVRDADDATALELAIVENLQREDLSPIEIARGYAELMRGFGYAQTRVAKQVGKDRATVANLLRLLRLPDEVQVAIDQGELSQGHGKVLLGLESRPERLLEIFGRILSGRLSVRQTEQLVRAELTGGSKTHSPDLPTASQTRASDLLSGFLRTRVDVRRRGKAGGEIVVRYEDDEELMRLVSAIQGDGW